ncbi:class I SAM-dependent methyltransferase [Streptomyces sp. FXJ1.172]|uniref:SAM-dependent methyltransferase n=1 Tax=Streptomyces sp. FXJ1.172 TaxID=710705 RepID=UPI0007CFC2FD|nr:class I SAM-dependent methyltransferase [Streptomyces sp. FXJ1.172]WEO95422.1 class I SAM-dependent methyltransferase [Streptomyces sp. FXJ1.172]
MSSRIGTPPAVEWTRGPAADLFSSYVATAAMSTAYQLGLLDQLSEKGRVALEDHDGRLDRNVLRQVYRALHWARIVEMKDDGSVTPGALFDDAYAARGYFYWLVKGCGELFSIAPDVTHEEDRQGSFYHRDMRAVAIGSRLIGEEEVENLFDSLLRDLPLKKVADLGCGSGQRLIRIGGNHPGMRGVGVDMSEAAVELATESVAEAGLAERITVLQGDVLALEPLPEFADVDTVTCVFMGHDFWPYDSCVNTLRRLRSAFPSAERLFICDVVRTTELPGPGTTIFTLGFESVHALMGDYLPTYDQWQKAFTEGGWECRTVRPTTTPPNGYLFELAPVPAQ